MSEKSEFAIRVDRNVYPRPEYPYADAKISTIPALGRAVNT